MAKLIMTITKRPEDGWFILHKDSIPQGVFTPEELIALDTYFRYIQDLPGLIPGMYTNTTEGDVNTAILYFDTLENATLGMSRLFDRPEHPEVAHKNAIVAAKMQALGYKYTLTKQIVE